MLAAVETVTRSMWLGTPIGIGTALGAKMPLAATLLFATPPILALSRAFPLADTPQRRRWEVHVAGALLLIVLIDFVSCGIAAVGYGAPFDLGTPRAHALRLVSLWLLPMRLLYGFIVAIDHSVRHFNAARDKAWAAAQLEAQLAQSRLAVRQSQLKPHFLFKALHSVGTLIRTGRSADAIRVSAGLGDMLRTMLEDAPASEASLRHELGLVRQYLDIEQIRFSDRLRVDYDVQPDVLDALVPHLVLQPLVENALRHGLQPLDEGGVLRIVARRQEPELVLQVIDTGAGLQPSSHTDSGVGLANTRGRLQALYGDRARLTLRCRPEGGTEALITLPLRLAVTTASPDDA
jgi:LytS/YehU family sensor histidine kinase